MYYLRPIINISYTKYKLPLNLYLIKWNPLSKTNIHNHIGKECYFFCLNKGLKEIIYKNNDLESKKIKTFKKNTLKQYSISNINYNIGYNQIINDDTKYKCIIHKYDDI